MKVASGAAGAAAWEGWVGWCSRSLGPSSWAPVTAPQCRQESCFPHTGVFSPCSSSVLSEAGEVKRPRPSRLCPVYLETEPLLGAAARLPS